MGTITTGIKLDSSTQARLRRLAKARRRSTHWLMKDAIDRYLEVEERFELEKAEDEARYRRFLDTGAHFTHDEMSAWLNELASRAAGKAQAG